MAKRERKKRGSERERRFGAKNRKILTTLKSVGILSVFKPKINEMKLFPTPFTAPNLERNLITIQVEVYPYDFKSQN